MKKNIKVGQKLYHFAYGPLTVTKVSYEERGNYVETVDDFPQGYRQKPSIHVCPQTWVLESIGHWLFESPDQVGQENNDWDWKKIWPDYTHEPLHPVDAAKHIDEEWHSYYFENGYVTLTGGKKTVVETEIGDPVDAVNGNNSASEIGDPKDANNRSNIESEIGDPRDKTRSNNIESEIGVPEGK